MTSNGNHDPQSRFDIAELKQLIAISRDGALQPAEHSRLEEILSTGRNARAMYIAYMQLDAGLDWKVRGRQSLDGLLRFTHDGNLVATDSTPHPVADKPTPLRKWRTYAYIAAALAASIAIVFASFVWLSLTEQIQVTGDDPALNVDPPENSTENSFEEALASVVAISDECRWFVEGRRTFGNSLQAGDTIRLTKGQLRLDFICGATVTLRSPAALQVISPKQAKAVLGTLTAHAGPGAEGFTIDTPRAKVVDLGTDFGIDVTDHGSTDVVVFNGAVDLHSEGVKGLRSRQRLGAGEGVRVSGEGTASRIVSILDSKFSIADRAASLRQVPVISEVRDNIRRGESWHYYEIVHGGMREDAKAFADRKDHEWNGIDKSGMPSYLIGGDYVRTFNDDKVNHDVEIRVTIERPAALYVLHDNRSPIPDWLRDDFIDTGDEIGMDGAGFKRYNVDAIAGVGPGMNVDDKLSIWRRDVPAGTVNLGAIQLGGERHNMYGIVAVPLEMDATDDDFVGSEERPSQGAKALDQSSDGRLGVNGAIERQGDADAFSFQWMGGVVQATCLASEYSTLDPVINIYDANDTLVGYACASRGRREIAHVTMNLPAGQYYALVAGGDEVGDVGYYHLAIAPDAADIRQAVAPSPSMALKAEPTPDGINLSWDAVPGAVSYQIERSSDGVSFKKIGTTDSTSMLDKSVQPGATYIYRLRRTTTNDLGASAPVKVRALPPAVVQLQSFGLGSTKIALSWRDVAGDQGYRIERSSDGDQFETITTTEPNAIGFRDATVAPGQRYFYRVSAVDGLKSGLQSRSVTAFSGVAGLELHRKGKDVVIRWLSGYPHEHLALERRVGCSTFVPIATFDNRATEFVDKGVPVGEKLRYRIVALGESSTLHEEKVLEIDRIEIPKNVDMDYFALRFDGKIKIRKAGAYTFHLNSDDGSRLTIDGVVVIDNDGRHANERVSGTIDLKPGNHDIEVQYFEFFGYSALRLSWTGPGIPREKVVPASALSSLKYRYYPGEWSNLPFHTAIGKSQVVSIEIPGEEARN